MSRRPLAIKREIPSSESLLRESSKDGSFTKSWSISKYRRKQYSSHRTDVYAFDPSIIRPSITVSTRDNDHANEDFDAKWGGKGVTREISFGHVGIKEKASGFFESVKNTVLATYVSITQKKKSGNNRNFRAKLMIIVVCVVFIRSIVLKIIVIQQRQDENKRQLMFLERLSKIGIRKIGSLGSKSKRTGIVDWPRGSKESDPARARQVDWWKQNPIAPIGFSCDVTPSYSSDKIPSIKASYKALEGYKYRGYEIPPPVFKGRTPVPPGPGEERLQVAVVIPFVHFQIYKVTSVITQFWSKNPPCLPGSEKVSAGLIFYTENSLSKGYKNYILEIYQRLGKDKIGCFFTDIPQFLSLTDEDLQMSHLEGAAFDFYMLFELLESKYETFMLVEPDNVPIQKNFLPAIVAESRSMRCDSDGLWQIGSLPLAKDVKYGLLKSRLDYHINGNSFYILGCPDFEEYKCRVQTYYQPKKKDCALMAGCTTHNGFEEGYDHALYRYRVQTDNYEYSRLVMHHFHYSTFMHNLGEAVYDPVEVVENFSSTYFVHSKSIYLTDAANILKEVTTGILKVEPCEHENWIVPIVLKAYRYLRTGEYTKIDAARYICQETLRSGKGENSVCNMYRNEAGNFAEDDWKDRMEGKTYIWTMDFHGGPSNCDIPIIREAGGVLHAEIGRICEFYGLCRDRLKVMRQNNWKEFDPTEQQIVDFKAAYKDDPEFKRVDAFLCHHP
eukprot:CAMPEP_0194394130 /NCGR_PEP_ID=MMETSP0174-20130528/123685_1 /TAXON_ID=216777 /ORGANISM="Proboscia alata, Strain PI-D3" /LENGTH=726 /DNA_ID=CAMNT_0039189897 /DNA_START=137 /DNA_END=2314 /DNA_ORIENTATION=+